MSKRKAPAAAVPTRRKPFRPVVDRRLDRTEGFFKRVARMSERALLAHNLLRPTADDHNAAALITQVRDLAAANFKRIRQPTLPI